MTNGTPYAERLVRYAELRPCKNAFVDTRTPGSDAKENFTVVGPGVSENPDQHVHIPEPHGFNIGGARQPPGCLNSQHSHLTAEVFVVHSGEWRFKFGVNADDGTVDLSPGDTISIPTEMFRGFENVGDDVGYLFAVLGGDDPGKVTWAPAVFDLAQQYGLVLLKGGRLVDTTVGEAVPNGAELEQAPTQDEIAALATPSAEKLASCVAYANKLTANARSALSADGVEEAAVITPATTDDNFVPGPIEGWWPHGFNVRRLTMQADRRIPKHTRLEAEVVFIQEGELNVSLPEGTLILGKGDTISLPVGIEREWHNASSSPMTAFIVRGGDAPAAPVMSAG